MPTTWDALKRVMRARFVPSYYACDLLHKLQQLRQGTKSVEEYYQELQMGMLRCNLVEDEEPAMARFLGGLNREIQDILAYKEYANVTRLFHLACKAEREVQGRRAVSRTNISAGKVTSWQPRTTTSMSGRAPVPSSSSNRAAPPSPSRDKARASPSNSANKSVQKPAIVLHRLHPRVEQEMSSAIVARAMGMCSVTVLASAFWWSKRMVSIPPLVNS